MSVFLGVPALNPHNVRGSLQSELIDLFGVLRFDRVLVAVEDILESLEIAVLPVLNDGERILVQNIDPVLLLNCAVLASHRILLIKLSFLMQTLSPLPLVRITPISPVSLPPSSGAPPLQPSFYKPNSTPLAFPAQHVDLPKIVSHQNRIAVRNEAVPIQSPIQAQIKRISILQDVNFPLIVDPKDKSYSPISYQPPLPPTDPKSVPLVREGRNHPLIINNLSLNNTPAQVINQTHTPIQRWPVPSKQPEIPVFRTSIKQTTPEIPVFKIPTQKMTIRIHQKQNSGMKFSPPNKFQFTEYPNITVVSTPPSQASNPPSAMFAAQKIKLKKRVPTHIETPITPQTPKELTYKIDTSHWQDNEQKPVLTALNAPLLQSTYKNIEPQPPKSKAMGFQQIKSMFYKIGIQSQDSNLVNSKIEPISEISVGQSERVQTNDFQVQTLEQPLTHNNMAVQIELPYQQSIPELESSNKVYYKSRRNIFPQEAFEPLAEVIPQILRLKPTSEALVAPTFDKPAMRLNVNQQKLNLFPNKQQSILKEKPICFRQYQYELQPVAKQQSKAAAPELQRDTVWFNKMIPSYPDTPTREKQLDFCSAVQQNIQIKSPSIYYKSGLPSGFSHSQKIEQNNQINRQSVVMVPYYQQIPQAQSQFFPMQYPVSYNQFYSSQIPYNQFYSNQMIFQQEVAQPLNEVLVYLYLNQDGKSKLKHIEVGNFIQKQNCTSVEQSNRKIENLMQMISLSRRGKQLSQDQLRANMEEFHQLMQAEARDNEQVQIDLTQIVIKQ